MKKNLLLTLSLVALLATGAYAATETTATPSEASNTASTTAAPATAGEAGTEEGTTATTPTEASGGESNPAAETTPAVAAEPAPIGVSEPETAGTPAPAATPDIKKEEGGHHPIELKQVDWSFNGPFGTFDRPAMQRGLLVYKNVCAACHSLNRLAYRNLAALGYNEGEIKTIAAEATVTDGPNDEGEMFERPGRPSDHFKAPFANDNAARYANNGALPPDLSLITRARADGSNYVYSLLTGFEEAPAGVTVTPGMHYNKYFAGHQIAMAAPLVEGSVTYDDGTAATVDQMAKDVSTFLTWAAEPVMEQRKQTGVKVILFLLVFAGLMYATKRRVWKDIH